MPKFQSNKTFIACYLDADFFQPRFRLDATQHIDAKIKEIDELMPTYVEKNIDTNDLNNEKSRLFGLRNEFGSILMRLKEALSLDIRDNQFDESIKRIVKTIKEKW